MTKTDEAPGVESHEPSTPTKKTNAKSKPKTKRTQIQPGIYWGDLPPRRRPKR